MAKLCSKSSCNKQIQANHHGIKCERCDKLFHKKCSGLNDNLWKQFQSGDMLFNCPSCKLRRKSSVFVPNAPTSSPITLSGPRNAVVSDGSLIEADSIGEVNLDEVRDGLSEFRLSLASIQAVNSEVSTSLTHLHDTVTLIENKLVSFEKKLKIVDEVQAENTRLRNQLTLLDKRVAVLESRKTSTTANKNVTEHQLAVTIGGVECDSNQNVNDIVSRVFAALELDIPTTDSRKISTKDGKSFILVPLKSRQILEDTIKASRTKRLNAENVGLSGSGIFVNERLSQHCYQLLCEARKLREHGFKFVWSRYGKVFARKEEGGTISHLKTSSDVDALVASR